MSVFVHRHSRVIIQGFTGQHATFHAEEAMQNGTTIVGGVTPGKGGQEHLGLPVFDTVHQAVEQTGADVAGIFVPPPFAADAIMEALEAGIGVVVVIADGIPVQDMVQVKRYAMDRNAVIIGPNTPGRIGVVSRSGTLNYEAVQQMSELGMGQSTSVGIGGDPVNGTDFVTVLRAFEADPDTDAVIMIGEIGGQQEVEAARWAREHMKKPVVGFIAGVSAPPGRRMGHAGAIISGQADTANAKMDVMEELGVHVVRNPALIGATAHRVFA